MESTVVSAKQLHFTGPKNWRSLKTCRSLAEGWRIMQCFSVKKMNKITFDQKIYIRLITTDWNYLTNFDLNMFFRP